MVREWNREQRAASRGAETTKPGGSIYGEDDEKVRPWLRTAAGVPWFIGFAVSRTTFRNLLVNYRAGPITRAAAAAQIAASYCGWVDHFEQAR